MSERIKVIDRRMFNADGELREDAAHPESDGREESKAETPVDPPRKKRSDEASSMESSEQPGRSADSVGERQASPQFLDLVGMLAEPVAVFLGDAKLPDGTSAENRELARFHIDLLDVLQEKTRGNLTADESSALEGLLYGLRLRWVEKGK